MDNRDWGSPAGSISTAGGQLGRSTASIAPPPPKEDEEQPAEPEEEEEQIIPQNND